MWNAPLSTLERAREATRSSPARDRSFARHVLLRQLGQNDLTRTYLATTAGAPGERTLVRLELLRKELGVDAELRARFLDHAGAILSLGHPQLAQAREVVTETETVGVSFEFFDGQPLFQILERVGRSRLPLALHLRILCDALDGLHHAHAHGGTPPGSQAIVHGDISPAHLFVTHEGLVKVTGVGFAGARRALERNHGALRSEVGYRAPEVFLGYDAGPAADVYGVGVMLWEAIAQCRRPLAIDPRSVARQRTRGEEPDIAAVSTDAPRRLRAICRKALAVSRRDRFETALAFKTELESYLDDIAGAKREATRAQLAELLRERFESEREEMQLFIGANVGTGEEAPAPAVAAPVTPGPASRDRASDSGEHRVFSTSLAPASAKAPAPKRAWLSAALGLAVLTGITVRWIERARSARSTAAEPAPVSERQPTRSSSVASGTSAVPLGARPPAIEAAAVVSHAAPDAPPGPEVPALSAPSPQAAPPAFLDLPSDGGGFEPARGSGNELPAVRAEDLPAVGDERTRLQESLVDAARRYRVRLAKREAALRAALRAAARAAAEAPPAPPIVDDNPYGP